MNIDPGWLELLAREGPVAYVLTKLFGPQLLRVVAALTDRALGPYEERTKTRALLARVDGDAAIEERKSELAQAPGPIVVPDLDFVLTQDARLLEKPSLAERARLGEAHRAIVREENLEAVFIKMLGLSPPIGTPGDRRPSRTWLNRFAESAGEAEEDTIRELWARLLANEIVSPDRFSLHTLGILRNLSSEIAILFNRVCDHALGDGFVVDVDHAFRRASGITYNDLLMLDELGLLKRDLAWHTISKVRPFDISLRYHDKILRFLQDGGSRADQLDLEGHSLSVAGTELSRLSEHRAQAAMLEQFEGIAKLHGLRLEVVDIESASQDVLDRLDPEMGPH